MARRSPASSAAQNMSAEILSFASDLELAAAAAHRWLNWVRAEAAAGRRPTVALAGGRITGSFYDEICRQAGADVESVRSVEFFWGDERCVPPDSPDSNFKLAHDRLLAPLKVPSAHWHRVAGERDPADAARQIETELRRLAQANAESFPALDLVLLGLGEDGHVASLFPGAPDDVTNSRSVYVPVIGPKPPPQRISLTYKTIAMAREVWVLVAGAGKFQPLREAITGASSIGLGRVLGQRTQALIFESVGHGSR
jgi:6-phosphogluconolactonase